MVDEIHGRPLDEGYFFGLTEDHPCRVMTLYTRERQFDVHFSDAGVLIYGNDTDASYFTGNDWNEEWPGILAQIPEALKPCIGRSHMCDWTDGDMELPLLSVVMWRLAGEDSWQAPRFKDPALVEDDTGDRADELFADLTNPSPEVLLRADELARGTAGTEPSRTERAAEAEPLQDGAEPAFDGKTRAALERIRDEVEFLLDPAGREYPDGRGPGTGKATTEELFRRTDSSGAITTAVFRYRAEHDQAHFTDLRVEVDRDMVVIGGGATAVDTPYGALLTASYPSADGTAWLVSSKDHGMPQPHRLTGFAIGMKIAGVSRERLARELLFIGRARGDLEPHPHASASAPEGYTLIGGGFRVNWNDGTDDPGPGNLATASFPRGGDTWTARSKDHLASHACTIDTFAVCLRSSFVVDDLLRTVDRLMDRVEFGRGPMPTPEVTSVFPGQGHVLTGIGAEVVQVEPGSLLWRLEPTVDGRAPGVHAAGKEHGTWGPTTMRAWTLGIRLLPTESAPVPEESALAMPPSRRSGVEQPEVPMRPTFADFSDGPIRTGNAEVSQNGCRDAGSHLAIGAGESVEMRFVVERPEHIQQATLTVTALVSKAGRSVGYAPMDVLLGGVPLAEALTVPGGGALPTPVSFAVPGHLLRPGGNTLVLRASERSRTMLWLYGITLDPVQSRGQSERALAALTGRESVVAFDTRWRVLDQDDWKPGNRLLVHIDRGENASLEHLSWRGTDGSEGGVCFRADLSAFTGWRRDVSGTLSELRGHRHDRWVYPGGTEGARVLSFSTEEEWGGDWHNSPDVLRLLLDDGGTPAEHLTWRDQRGNSGSVALREREGDFIGYYQRRGEGPIGYRGTTLPDDGVLTEVTAPDDGPTG
ncbi:hypothetical protein [Streptomyces scopuliridis]|uniref:hypothetical protein n=1 Tax=Streptomyces scopuliridis TaxID=452529 RepID=UPI0034159CD6